jgi:hypothetical protein
MILSLLTLALQASGSGPWLRAETGTGDQARPAPGHGRDREDETAADRGTAGTALVEQPDHRDDEPAPHRPGRIPKPAVV